MSAVEVSCVVKAFCFDVYKRVIVCTVKFFGNEVTCKTQGVAVNAVNLRGTADGVAVLNLVSLGYESLK